MTKVSLILSSIIVVVVAFGVTACAPEEEPSVEKVTQPVKVVAVSSMLSDPVRRFPAQVAASETANIAANVSGQILSIPVKSGDEVKKGTLLLALDATDYELDLDQTQANYDLAKVSYERTSKSRARNIATQADYDQAKATFDQAKVSLQLAKNRLEDTRVYAPFDGTVVRVETDEFDYISAAQTLMTMHSTANIDIEFQLPSDIVATISKQKAQAPLNVVFDAFSSVVYQARIKEFNADSDRSTHAFDAKLTMKAPSIQGNLLPGMNATVLVDMRSLGKADLLTVPARSVFNRNGQSLVWVLGDDDQVTATPVELGELYNNDIIVLSGLKADDQVVAAGVHKLIDGQEVAVWSGE